MAELTNVYNERDLLIFFQHLRLEVAKKLNDKHVEETKTITEEKRTFKGTMKNIGNALKRSVGNYDKKDSKIESDLSSFAAKNYKLMSRGEATDLANSLFNDDTHGLSKLLFACTVILDSEYDYKYVDDGLKEVSLILFGNQFELPIIKKQLEDNYNAISPTSLSPTQKGILMGAALVSLAGVVCLPVLFGAGVTASAASTTAALAAHGFGDMQLGIAMISMESLLLSAALTGATYGAMKLYNSQKVKSEFKKMSPEKNALYLAIQATHIQRLAKTMNKEELKEQLDVIFKNLNILKADLDYFLFVEQEATKDNKQKIKSFHDFDNRLIKVLGL